MLLWARTLGAVSPSRHAKHISFSNAAWAAAIRPALSSRVPAKLQSAASRQDAREEPGPAAQPEEGR